MHTPGPWTIDKSVIRGKPMDDFARGIMVASIPGIADIDEDEGNMRLIAAAPDLLDALTDLVGGCGKEGDLFSSTALAKCRASIEKATARRNSREETRAGVIDQEGGFRQVSAMPKGYRQLSAALAAGGLPADLETLIRNYLKV